MDRVFPGDVALSEMTGLGKEGIPAFGCLISGHYHRARVVAPIDKLIEVLSLSFGKFFHGKIVKYQQIGLQVVLRSASSQVG